MKIFGYTLLLGGFLWLTYDVAIGFTEDQYALWVGYSKTKLPDGKLINRGEVVGVMRALCLDLKNRHRFVILPATMMLVGGLMIGHVRPRLAAMVADPANRPAG